MSSSDNRPRHAIPTAGDLARYLGQPRTMPALRAWAGARGIPDATLEDLLQALEAHGLAARADGGDVWWGTHARAPVQPSGGRPGTPGYRPSGTVSWSEHRKAWEAYAAKYGSYQSSERIAERAGFSWEELCTFLGREPHTWLPRASGADDRRYR